MSANCLHTTLMTCSILTLAGGLTGDECQVDWIPPHKVPFKADLSVKSWLALEGATPTHNHGWYEKNVLVTPDGMIRYEVDETADEYQVDADSESWAHGSMAAILSGQTSANGFEIGLTLDGISESYNGSTEIKADTRAYYSFTLEEEARFGFITWNWDLGPEVQMEVWLTNLENGVSIMMDDLEAHDPDANPRLQPGGYMVDLHVSTNQQGCEEGLRLGGTVVAEMWFECVEFTPVNGDINKDRIVDGKDLALLISGFKDYFKDADLNEDGKVNGEDLAILLANWSK